MADIDKLRSLHTEIMEEKKIINQISNLSQTRGNNYKIQVILRQLRKTNENIAKTLNELSLKKPSELGQVIKEMEKPRQEIHKIDIPEIKHVKPVKKTTKTHKPKKIHIERISEFERDTLKRLKKKKKKVAKKKFKKPSSYVKLSNSFFSNMSVNLTQKKMFRSLKRDLIKANLSILPTSYVSVILFTTLLSIFVGICLTIFFLFFSITSELPIIKLVEESIATRLLKVFWIVIAIPIATFLFMYIYPSLERRAGENKINQELPFATIHMSAISGSMIEPSRIFDIIISTGEYEHISKEFTKLINEINIYGYDLVSALRNSAYNSPSKKLGELFNGIATTISSGGDLPEFFDKRAQSLLFEYRLEREKYTRTAETFMDIYISVVIAAPMIFMLLLMMIKISGLGIAISNQMITLLMVLGVTGINIVFLTFLHLKQPTR